MNNVKMQFIEANRTIQADTVTLNTLNSPKTTISLPSPVLSLFYDQKYIICKSEGRVLIYSSTDNSYQVINLQIKDFVLLEHAPYLFCLLIGQFLHFYSEASLKNQHQIYKAKISKMQPITVCRYNKGYFFGGYNRSILPGQRRTTRRAIYFIEKLSFEDKNLPDYIIKINESQTPVSQIYVQNPYLVAYCQPTMYIISVKTKQILLTFDKQISSFLILEGRFAFSALNGFGISKKNTIFTFDFETSPVFGIQVSQHGIECESFCLQKTGKIFGCKKNIVYCYNPIKQTTTNLKIYEQKERVVQLRITALNDLLIARMCDNGWAIDVIGLN